MSTLKKLVLTFVHIPYTQTHKYIYFRVKWRIWLNYFPQVLKPINSFILFSWLPKGLVRVILTVQKVACNCCKSLCLYWTNQLTTKYINSLTFFDNESVRKKKFVSIFFIKMILSFILVWFAKWSMVFFFFFFFDEVYGLLLLDLSCFVWLSYLYFYVVILLSKILLFISVLGFFHFFSLHKMTKIISLWLKLGFGDILSPFFCLIIPYYILWCILGILYLGNQHATIIYVYKNKKLYIIRLIYMTIHFELHIKWRSVSYFL